MRPLCLGILPAIWTVARLATESPKISYTVSIPEPQTHLFHIELGIQGWSAPQIEVSMPVWSTGYYHVLDFAGQVVKLMPDIDKTKTKQKGAYLGVRVTEEDSEVRITHVLRDTAAWRDGLNFDDEILAINGIRIPVRERFGSTARACLAG